MRKWVSTLIPINVLCLVEGSSVERGDLDFVMLKPDRFLQLRSFQFYLVETERLVNVGVGDGIDDADGSFQSSVRAITDDAYTAALGKYLMVHKLETAPGSSPMGGSGQRLFLHVRSIPSNLEKSNKGTVIFADQ